MVQLLAVMPLKLQIIATKIKKAILIQGEVMVRAIKEEI
jgi:hypothetical protein